MQATDRSRTRPAGGHRYDRVVTLPRILSAVGRTLAVLGVVMLLFVAFELWGTGLQQAQAQDNLEGDLAERLRQAVAAGQGALPVDTGDGPDAAAPVSDPDPAAPVSDPATAAPAASSATPSGDPDTAAAAPRQDGDSTAAGETAGAAPEGRDAEAAPPPTAPESLPEYQALPHAVQQISEAAGARSVARLLDPEVEALLPLVYPDNGEAIARMIIPAIDVDEIVVAGVEVEDLRKGPGHYSTTPLPGQPGNAAIAGHRTTYGAPFGQIDELAPGDEIIIETLQGRFVYRVLPGGRGMAGRTPGHRIVAPTALEVLDDQGDNRLTLTSCHPKYSSKQRIIVHAELVGDPVVRLPRPGEPIGAEFVQLAQPEDVPNNVVDAELPDEPNPAAADSTEPDSTDVTDRREAPADDAADPETADDSSDTGDTGSVAAPEARTAAAPRAIPARTSAVPEDGFGEGLSGDRDAILPAVLWGLAAMAVWTLGWAFGRSGRRLRVYAIAAVPFLVVLYVMFSYVDRALPAY